MNLAAGGEINKRISGGGKTPGGVNERLDCKRQSCFRFVATRHAAVTNGTRLKRGERGYRGTAQFTIEGPQPAFVASFGQIFRASAGLHRESMRYSMREALPGDGVSRFDILPKLHSFFPPPPPLLPTLFGSSNDFKS